VVTAASHPEARRRDGNNSEWATEIECINATGKWLTTTIIFKAGSQQDQYYHKNNDRIPDWYFCNSVSGWSDDERGFQWLGDVFIPESAPEKSGESRLLLLDGHTSHKTPRFVTLCFDNNV
jgi:hypothetical protein